MNRHTFTVDVVTDTVEHAHMVMVERLGYEKDYDFPYRLSWTEGRVQATPGARVRVLTGARMGQVGVITATPARRYKWVKFEDGAPLPYALSELEVLP